MTKTSRKATNAEKFQETRVCCPDRPEFHNSHVCSAKRAHASFLAREATAPHKMAKTAEKAQDATKSRFCRRKEKKDTKTLKIRAKPPKTAPKHPENPNRSQSAQCVPKNPSPAFPRHFPGISPAFPRHFLGISSAFSENLPIFWCFSCVFRGFGDFLVVFAEFSVLGLFNPFLADFFGFGSPFPDFSQIAWQRVSCSVSVIFFLNQRRFVNFFRKLTANRPICVTIGGKCASFRCPTVFFRKCSVSVVYENWAKINCVTFFARNFAKYPEPSPSTTFDETSTHPQQDLDSAGQLSWKASPMEGIAMSVFNLVFDYRQECVCSKTTQVARCSLTPPHENMEKETRDLNLTSEETVSA